jgi:hypothetical protein
MARKTPVANTVKQSTQITVQNHLARHYASHCRIEQGLYDCRIYFSQVTTDPDHDQTYTFRETACVSCSPEFLKVLAKYLAQAVTAYEKDYRPIAELRDGKVVLGQSFTAEPEEPS